MGWLSLLCCLQAGLDREYQVDAWGQESYICTPGHSEGCAIRVFLKRTHVCIARLLRSLQDREEVLDLQWPVLSEVCAVHAVLELVEPEQGAQGLGTQHSPELGVHRPAELTELHSSTTRYTQAELRTALSATKPPTARTCLEQGTSGVRADKRRKKCARCKF